MSPVKIAAVSDVHSPRFLNEFKMALQKCEPPDVFLFAGDMINRGKVDEYPLVLDLLDSHLGSDFPVIACFGNEEPVTCREDLHLMTEDRVTFLDEKVMTLDISGSSIAIAGISTAYEPTDNYLSESVTEIKVNFEERSKRLSSLLHDASKSSNFVVLLMHFSPLSATNSSEFSWWVSRAIEKNPPSYIFHGHVHDSTKNNVKLRSIVIRNVALPATGSITELNVWD